MELRTLITLKTIVEEGGYQKAADKLGYSQSAITAQIKQLEEELHIKLFERLGRNMRLTQQGQLVVAKAEEMMILARQIESIGKTAAELNGTLQIEIAETLLCHKMLPVIRAFRAAAPNVCLSIRMNNCLSIAHSVKMGSCDLGIDYDTDCYDNMFETKVLGQYELILVGSPLLKETDFITPFQKKSVSFVIDEPDSIFRLKLENYLRQNKIELEATIELWSIETIKRCVIENLGITFLPRFAAQEELEKGLLVELPCPINHTVTTAQCIWHKNRWISPEMALFLKLTGELLSKD